MIPGNYEIAQERAELVITEAMNAPEMPGEEEPYAFEVRNSNWIAMSALGVLLIIGGLWMFVKAPAFGGGIIVVGFLIIAGSRLAKRWEEGDKALAEPNLEWNAELSAMTEARGNAFAEAMAAAERLQMRSQMRRMQIEEVVRAVKTTTRVRCIYCGTLNEEEAGKCESCGASLRS